MSTQFFSFLSDYEIKVIYDSLELYIDDLTFIDLGADAADYPIARTLPNETRENILKLQKLMTKLKMEMRNRTQLKKTEPYEEELKWIGELENIKVKVNKRKKSL
jgi:hypothetical protein